MNLTKGILRDKIRQITVASVDEITKYAQVSSVLIRKLRKLLPGPYTFIFEARSDYSLSELTLDYICPVDSRGLVEQGKLDKLGKSTKVAIRVPRSRLLLNFIRYYGKPIATTSANMTGDNPALTIDQVDKQIYEKIGCALSVGILPENPVGTTESKSGDSERMPFASAIIDVTTKPAKIIRNHPMVEYALIVINK